MPFLSLNGWTVPVADGQARTSNFKPGQRKRSARGRMRQSERYVRRTWLVETTVLTFEESEALMRLACGEGHFWDFADGLQASTSLTPLPGYSSSVRLNPQAWGAFGKGCAQLGVLRYDVQARDDEWCALWWQWNASTLAWDGCALRSDGMGYLNGVRNDAVGGGNPPNVTGGIFQFAGTGGFNFDDLAFLPYKPSTSMLAAFTTATGKFGPCPLVRVTGDMVAGATVFCVGEVEAVPFRQGAKPTWQNNLRTVRIKLREMDPAYYLGVLTQGVTTPAVPVSGFGGPSLWFDAANVDGEWNAVTADGAAVNTWLDLGSRSQDLTQGVGGAQPILRKTSTRKLGDSPVLVFDGVDDFMSTTVGGFATAPVTIAVVFRMSALTVATVFDGVAAGTGRHALRRNAANQFEAFCTLSAVYPSAVPTVAQYAYSVMRYDGSGAAPWVMNGAAQASVNTGSDADLQGIRVGSAFGGGGFLNGQIVELLVWEDTVPSDNLAAKVEAYFEAKYGPLPQV